MGHVALYRAWRPKVFADLIGQSVIVTTLQNAMKNNRVHHAYLFSGPRGTGKTSAAKLLAKAVNCRQRVNGIEPCNACDNCESIQSGASVEVLEIDAASNRGIDEIRDLRENVRFAAVQVPYKVYIIDEVHMLTTEAFNALLKTLEEPPSQVVFILATTEPHKLPATIVSRCLRFDFRRIYLDEQMERLRFICMKENILIEEEALRLVARLSEGGMRDALSLLEQAVTFTDQNTKIKHDELIQVLGGVPVRQMEQLFLSCNRGDIADALQIMDEWIQSGRSVERILEQWMQMIRDLLLFRLSPESHAWKERATIRVDLAEKLLQQIVPQRLESWLQQLDKTAAEIRNSTMPTLLLEMALMKCCTIIGSSESHVAVSSVESDEKVRQLEQKVRLLEQAIIELRKQPRSETEATRISPDQTKPLHVFSPTASKPALQSAGAIEALLNDFVNQHDPEKLNAVLSAWPDVLQNVKEKKITLHAWLRDGDPARMCGQRLLILFKNTMHRDTIDKSTNRELVEQSIEFVTGQSIRVVTLLQKEWDERSSTLTLPAPTLSDQSGFQLEHEQRDSGWIDDVINHFGRETVTILDDIK